MFFTSSGGEGGARSVPRQGLEKFSRTPTLSQFISWCPASPAGFDCGGGLRKGQRKGLRVFGWFDSLVFGWFLVSWFDSGLI